MPVSPAVDLRCALAAALLLAIASLGCAGVRAAGVGGGGQTGLASYYAQAHHGRRTASGEVFDMEALTAAHRSLPFGTRVRVTNLDNGRRTVVRINDRGPFRRGRIIDVSRAAALALGMARRGIARVRLEILGDGT